MTTEHIITREMLFATLHDVMKERDDARRARDQYQEDYSKTLTNNTKLREQIEALTRENHLLTVKLHPPLVSRTDRIESVDFSNNTIPNNVPEARIKELKNLLDHATRTVEDQGGAIINLEALVRTLQQKQCQCVPVLEEKIKKLESQLPEQMQSCTILYNECENGHGNLTATNWIPRSCPWCRLLQLENVIIEALDAKPPTEWASRAREALRR